MFVVDTGLSLEREEEEEGAADKTVDKKLGRIFKLWSQHQHHLGTCYKYKVLRPIEYKFCRPTESETRGAESTILCIISCPGHSEQSLEPAVTSSSPKNHHFFVLKPT